MTPSRVASAANNAGSSVARSRERGHHAPSTYPWSVLGVAALRWTRDGCTAGSESDADERSCGTDVMPALTFRAETSAGRVRLGRNRPECRHTRCHRPSKPTPAMCRWLTADLVTWLDVVPHAGVSTRPRKPPPVISDARSLARAGMFA